MDKKTKQLMAEALVEMYDLNERNIGRTIKNIITGRRARVIGGAPARAHQTKDRVYGLARSHMDDYRWLDNAGKLAALSGNKKTAHGDWDDADAHKEYAQKLIKKADRLHASANAFTDEGKAKKLARSGFGRSKK